MELIYTAEEITLLKRTKLQLLNEDELQLAIYQSKDSGLNYLKNQIYAQVYIGKKDQKRSLTFITSIDGYRLIAARTGEMAGSDDPILITDDKGIVKATVSVYRLVQGHIGKFTATAYFTEYYPQYNTSMWDKMPATMISKCAEALALRKAFPNELGNMYTKEEMDQASNDIAVDPVLAATSAIVASEKTPVKPLSGPEAVKQAIASSKLAAEAVSADAPGEIIYPFAGRHANKKLKLLSYTELDDTIRFFTKEGEPRGRAKTLVDACRKLLIGYSNIFDSNATEEDIR